MIGYLLSDDLMFSSRITATARSQGSSIKVARSAADVEKLHAAEPASCVIVDLSNPGLDIAALVNGLRANSAVRVIAYGSHVDTATLQAARDAGCDVVLPRSKFVEELSTALPTWFAPR